MRSANWAKDRERYFCSGIPPVGYTEQELSLMEQEIYERIGGDE